MAIQPVNIGSAPNDGLGDPLRAAFARLNNNVAELVLEVQDGRVVYLSGVETPSGAAIGNYADFVICGHNATNTLTSWRLIGPPTPAIESDVLKLDSGGRWWRRMMEVSIGAAIRDSGVLPTIVGGNGNAIALAFTPAIIEAGVSAMSSDSVVEYIPTQTNTVANPTVSVQNRNPVEIRNADGGPWPVNGFVVGRYYTLRNYGGTMRVASGAVTMAEIADIYNNLGAMLAGAIASAREAHVAAPGDDVVLVEGDNGPALLTRADGVTRGTYLASDIIGEGNSSELRSSGAPGDYIAPLVTDLAGNIVLGFDERDGSTYPASSGGGGGSTVEFVDPDNLGDAWNSIQTTDSIGPVIRYLSRQWRETWGYEKRGNITIAQTPDPAIGILTFGGGSAAVVRPIADDFPYHVFNETIVRPEDGISASAHAIAWLEGEFAARRGLPTVIALSQVVSSTVESDALPGSAARTALRQRVEAAKTALEGWGKGFLVDRINLSLLEGAPNTGAATADLHYAAVANGLRQEIADAAGQVPMPIVVVNQSAGTRTSGTSEVILAEGNLDWAHWSLGLVVATPRYPFPLAAGSPSAVTPEAAMQISELEALAASERLAARNWFGPTMGAQCSRSGAVITVPFTTMLPLVLRNPAQHGFRVDGVTNGATIASVAVSGSNAIITMSVAPTGNLTVRYAFGETGDRGDGYPCNRGSLTDSWSQPSRMVSGATLYRYARSGRAPVL